MNDMQDTPTFSLLLMVAIGVFFLLVALALYLLLLRPWLRAVLHGLAVTLPQIVGMRLRGNSPALLIDACISLKRAGVSVTLVDIETVYIDHKNRILTSDDLVRWVEENIGQGGMTTI